MILVKEVHKSYGKQKVLDGVSFEVERGSVTTIMGGSGSGKSVLVRQMLGLERPDSGEIIIDGKNIVGMNSAELNQIRRRFGVLFQEAALFDSLTVMENVAFPAREHLKLSKKELRELVENKLAGVGMARHKEKFPAELSGGMRKRVGLARALTLDPDVVFFDEPDSGLDPITKATIYDLILTAHRERTVTYVLVSHDTAGAMEISDKIMILMNGKIVEQGSPLGVKNSTDPAIRQFLSGSLDGPLSLE
jgi:phospholipid/cholesterol/gamma-HCH transport system ATP-binding protein